MGAVLVMGGASYATPSPTSTPATNTAGSERAQNGCLPPGHDDAWPDWVQGRPDGFDRVFVGDDKNYPGNPFRIARTA